MFDKNAIEQCKEYFKKKYPNEAVCFLLKNNEVVFIENISLEPANTFKIKSSLFLKYKKQLKAVLHSHPGELLAYPSKIDMQSQLVSNVPWGIVCCDVEMASEPIWFGNGVNMPPLIGAERYFRHGVTDCYSLIKDYYKLELNIDLLEFPRDWEWWEAKDEELYLLGYEKTGFRKIEFYEARKGDAFLAKTGLGGIRNNIINHGGIYLGGSGDMILHHLGAKEPVDYTRVAVKEPGARYLKYITHILRHKDNEYSKT